MSSDRFFSWPDSNGRVSTTTFESGKMKSMVVRGMVMLSFHPNSWQITSKHVICVWPVPHHMQTMMHVEVSLEVVSCRSLMSWGMRRDLLVLISCNYMSTRGVRATCTPNRDCLRVNPCKSNSQTYCNRNCFLHIPINWQHWTTLSKHFSHRFVLLVFFLLGWFPAVGLQSACWFEPREKTTFHWILLIW